MIPTFLIMFNYDSIPASPIFSRNFVSLSTKSPCLAWTFYERLSSPEDSGISFRSPMQYHTEQNPSFSKFLQTFEWRGINLEVLA